MPPENSTADAICRHLGMPGFVDLSLPSPALRVVLQPAFAPEVCITVVGGADRAEVRVDALGGMFWWRMIPRCPSPIRETAAADSKLIRWTDAGFTATLEDPLLHAPLICLDGMMVTACRVEDGLIEQFAAHAFQPSVREFVARLTWTAWMACRRPEVRHALGGCAEYVGKRYPRQSSPTCLPPTRLLVLGTPDARADFFAQLKRLGGRAC